jgi:hypothetical protein
MGTLCELMGKPEQAVGHYKEIYSVTSATRTSPPKSKRDTRSSRERMTAADEHPQLHVPVAATMKTISRYWVLSFF